MVNIVLDLCAYRNAAKNKKGINPKEILLIDDINSLKIIKRLAIKYSFNLFMSVNNDIEGFKYNNKDKNVIKNVEASKMFWGNLVKLLAQEMNFNGTRLKSDEPQYEIKRELFEKNFPIPVSGKMEIDITIVKNMEYFFKNEFFITTDYKLLKYLLNNYKNLLKNNYLRPSELLINLKNMNYI